MRRRYARRAALTSVVFLPTGGDSGDGRRRTLDALLSAVQFKPGRAAVVANQHEHEPAAKTYSGIFFTISVAQASGRQASQPERRYGKK